MKRPSDKNTAQVEQELQFTRFAMENAAVEIYWLGKDARIHYVNRQACETLGYSKEELLMLGIPDLDPLFPIEHWNEHWEKLKQDKRQTFETLHRRKNGEVFPIRVIANYVQYGDLEYNVAYAWDLTEVKKRDAALVQSEEQFRLLFENIPDGVVVQAADGKIVASNHMAEELLGLSSDQMRGQMSMDPRWYAIQEDGSPYPGEMRPVMIALRTGRPVHNAIMGVFNPRRGEVRWLEINAVPQFRVGETMPYQAFSMFSDVTERRQMEAQIRQLAFYDLLTNLPNRRLLNDRLDQALAASKRSGKCGALMVLDLDNFKPLNDQYGHAVGDLLLVEVARRLSSCVREVDTVARLGGDEFVVLLSELENSNDQAVNQAEMIAEKILHRLAEVYELAVPGGISLKRVTHQCTVSIGVAMFLGYQVREDELLKRADVAMYAAKDAGRNKIRFSDEERAA